LVTDSGSGVDETPETLLAEDRQRCCDTVQNPFDVDVDHLLPILDAQVVEGRNVEGRLILIATCFLLPAFGRFRRVF